jgi:hypothetical protein
MLIMYNNASFFCLLYSHKNTIYMYNTANIHKLWNRSLSAVGSVLYSRSLVLTELAGSTLNPWSVISHWLPHPVPVDTLPSFGYMNVSILDASCNGSHAALISLWSAYLLVVLTMLFKPVEFPSFKKAISLYVYTTFS